MVFPSYGNYLPSYQTTRTAGRSFDPPLHSSCVPLPPLICVCVATQKAIKTPWGVMILLKWSFVSSLASAVTPVKFINPKVCVCPYSVFQRFFKSPLRWWKLVPWSLIMNSNIISWLHLHQLILMKTVCPKKQQFENHWFAVVLYFLYCCAMLCLCLNLCCCASAQLLLFGAMSALLKFKF